MQVTETCHEAIFKAFRRCTGLRFFLLHEVSPIFLIRTPTFSDPAVTWQPVLSLSDYCTSVFKLALLWQPTKANRKGQQHAVEVTRAAPWIPTALHAGKCSVQHTYLLQTLQCLSTRLVTTRSESANSLNPCFLWHAGVLCFLPCKYCSNLSFA